MEDSQAMRMSDALDTPPPNPPTAASPRLLVCNLDAVKSLCSHSRSKRIEMTMIHIFFNGNNELETY